MTTRQASSFPELELSHLCPHRLIWSKSQPASSYLVQTQRRSDTQSHSGYIRQLNLWRLILTNLKVKGKTASLAFQEPQTLFPALEEILKSESPAASTPKQGSACFTRWRRRLWGNPTRSKSLLPCVVKIRASIRQCYAYFLTRINFLFPAAKILLTSEKMMVKISEQ